MPNVKDFKDKQKKRADSAPHSSSQATEASTEKTDARAKRRPGREEPETSTAEVKVVDVEEGVRLTAGEELHEAHVHAEKEAHHTENASSFESSFEEPAAGEKIEIHFFGSELIRSKFPKPFELVEAVATDWMKDGDFKHLPIEHPLAQYVAQSGLKRAKEVEKKVLESPVTEKVAMQVLTAGMKAQSVIEEIRSRLKKDSKPE